MLGPRNSPAGGDSAARHTGAATIRAVPLYQSQERLEHLPVAVDVPRWDCLVLVETSAPTEGEEARRW
jgi:hypothetical protein